VARRRGAAWERERLYDGQIFLRGEVPSREDQWHDYFNMCAWCAFPRAKAALNAEQWFALCRWLPEPCGTKLPGARLREQDALALTDEGGVLLLVESASGACAQEFAASGDLAALEALVARRAAMAMPFGHALYEHLMTGSGEVRGALIILPVQVLPVGRSEAILQADEALAARLRSGVHAFRGAPGVSMRLAESGAPKFA
jgi:hypothetical protein